MLKFPSMFHLARDKEAKVMDYWVPMGDGGVWNVGLCRRLNDWELIWLIFWALLVLTV